MSTARKPYYELAVRRVGPAALSVRGATFDGSMYADISTVIGPDDDWYTFALKALEAAEAAGKSYGTFDSRAPYPEMLPK